MKLKTTLPHISSFKNLKKQQTILSNLSEFYLDRDDIKFFYAIRIFNEDNTLSICLFHYDRLIRTIKTHINNRLGEEEWY